MKAMILLAGERRRLLRAAVVGGMGSTVREAGRLASGPDHRATATGPADTDTTSRNPLGADERGTRRD